MDADRGQMHNGPAPEAAANCPCLAHIYAWLSMHRQEAVGCFSHVQQTTCPSPPTPGTFTPNPREQ